MEGFVTPNGRNAYCKQVFSDNRCFLMCQLWRQKSNPGLHIIQTVSHAKQKEVMRTFKTEKLKSCSSVRLRASAPLWSSVYPQHSSVRRLHSLEAPSDIWSRLKWHRNTPWKTRRLARRDFVPRQQKIVWCVKRLQLKEKKKKKAQRLSN